MLSSLFKKKTVLVEVPITGQATALPHEGFSPRQQYDWTLLTDRSRMAYDEANSSVVPILVFPPTFALDVGCNTGSRALDVKTHFPHSKVWGVEPNATAAAVARSRIDRVVSGLLEQIDWPAEGVQAGEIDTVILFDVLEHMYDPWTALISLRNLVSANAQMLVSIPNVRNTLLIQDLVNGTWRYRAGGLLDVTHIRFFTWTDVVHMFYQTGFRLVGQGRTYDSASKAILDRYANGPFPLQVQLERLSIEVTSREDLESLCAMQNIGIFQPIEYEELDAEERRLVDGPFRSTLAFSGTSE